MAENILTLIAATKRLEVEAAKAVISQEALARMAAECRRAPLSMKEAILKGSGIIAEHKRRSPSKGEISPMSQVATVAKAYAAGGASAMSVLTDTPYFGGSPADLAVARQAAPRLPLLRKEFILDRYQLLEARLAGADAVLLIAAMLQPGKLKELNDAAHSLGLETLVEIHSAEEAAAIPPDADMVGVNNRDLTTFSTDTDTSARLAGLLPEGAVKIAESGIRTPADLIRLRRAGFDGFLIGETFMSAPEPGEKLMEFAAAGGAES